MLAFQSIQILLALGLAAAGLLHPVQAVVYTPSGTVDSGSGTTWQLGSTYTPFSITKGALRLFNLAAAQLTLFASVNL